MSVRKVEVPVGQAMREITIEVCFTGMKVLRARMWVASWLFRAGALLAGTKIEIKVPERTD